MTVAVIRVGDEDPQPLSHLRTCFEPEVRRCVKCPFRRGNWQFVSRGGPKFNDSSDDRELIVIHRHAIAPSSKPALVADNDGPVIAEYGPSGGNGGPGILEVGVFVFLAHPFPRESLFRWRFAEFTHREVPLHGLD
jgi:hypothetical protein